MYAVPDVDEVVAVAKELGIHLGPDEAVKYQKYLIEQMEELDTFVQARIDEPKPPMMSPARSPGYRPSAEEDPLNAWVWKCRIEGESDGLLAGKTASYKDHIAVAGIPMSFGAFALEGFIPDFDATVVNRVLKEGGTIIGKNVMNGLSGGFGTGGGIGDYGRPLNPHNHDHVTGGSSSGSAAAVSAGEVDISFGGDQGGSIRIPASFTGLFGIKPTFGLCPNESGLRAMSDFVAPGPLTRCVADARTILEILAERKYHRQSLGSESLRVVWCPNPEDRPVDPEVAKVLDSAVTKLSDLGHKVEENRLPLEGWNSAFATLVLAEEQRERGKLLEQSPEQLTDYERKSLEAGRRLTIKDVENARSAHSEYQQRLREFFKDVDIIAIPSTATTAFPIRQRPQEIDGKRVSSLWGAVPFTAPFNVSGNPAVSIPCGLCDNLPVGLQLVGQWNAEELLLNLTK